MSCWGLPNERADFVKHLDGICTSLPVSPKNRIAEECILFVAVFVLQTTPGAESDRRRLLAVSVATIKIRLHRARRKLQEVMEIGCFVSEGHSGVPCCEAKK